MKNIISDQSVEVQHKNNEKWHALFKIRKIIQNKAITGPLSLRRIHRQNVLKALYEFLDDSDDKIRCECIALLSALIPQLQFEVDTFIAIFIPKIMPNISSKLKEIRIAVTHFLYVYLRYTNNLQVFLKYFTEHGIENSDLDIKKECLLLISILFGADFAHENLTYLILSVAKQLLVKNTEIFYLAFHAMNKLKEIINEHVFISCLNNVPHEELNMYESIIHLNPEDMGTFACNVNKDGNGETLAYGIINIESLEKLKDDAWRIRRRGVKEIRKAVYELCNLSVLYPHLQDFLLLVSNLLGDPKGKVRYATLELVDTIAEKLGKILGHYLRNLVFSLSRNLINKEMKLRESSIAIIRKIMYEVHPMAVLKILLERRHSHNPLLREEIINLITSAVLSFPKYNFDFSQLCDSVVPALTDKTPCVRQAAVECLFVLSSSMECSHKYTPHSVSNLMHAYMQEEVPERYSTSPRAICTNSSSYQENITRTNTCQTKRVSSARSESESCTFSCKVQERSVSAQSSISTTSYIASCKSENITFETNEMNVTVRFDTVYQEEILQKEEAHEEMLGNEEKENLWRICAEEHSLNNSLDKTGMESIPEKMDQTFLIPCGSSTPEIPPEKLKLERPVIIEEEEIIEVQECVPEISNSQSKPEPKHEETMSFRSGQLVPVPPPAKLEEMLQDLKPYPSLEYATQDSKYILNMLSSQEWKLKVEGMAIIIRLAKFHPAILHPGLHINVMKVIEEVKSVRAVVAEAAILTLGQLFAILGKTMEPELTLVTSALLNKSGSKSTTYTYNMVIKSISEVMESVLPQKATLALLATGSRHLNQAVRETTAYFLMFLVEKMGYTKCLGVSCRKLIEKLLPATARLCTDGSPVCRYFGKRIFHTLMASPSFDSLLNKYVADSVISNIARTLTLIKRKGVGQIPGERVSTKASYLLAM